MTLCSRIDLVGVLSPVCLLEYKKALKNMASGDRITIRLDDPTVLRDLITIIKRSDDEILKITEEAAFCEIAVRKN